MANGVPAVSFDADPVLPKGATFLPLTCVSPGTIIRSFVAEFAVTVIPTVYVERFKVVSVAVKVCVEAVTRVIVATQMPFVSVLAVGVE